MKVVASAPEDSLPPPSSDKVVYVGMSADVLHAGHVRLLDHASQLGLVVVGLLSDRAVAGYKRLPMMPFEDRWTLVEGLRTVTRVVVQDTLDYRPNLERLRPDFVVHGDDWRVGVQSSARRQVIDTLSSWGGQLVEPAYTEGYSSSAYLRALRDARGKTDCRREALRRLLQLRLPAQFLAVNGALGATLVEHIHYTSRGSRREFSGLWLPHDGGPLRERLALLPQLLECTAKPVIFELSKQPDFSLFKQSAHALERSGVSGLLLPADLKLLALAKALTRCTGTLNMVSLSSINSLEQTVQNALCFLEDGADAILLADSSFAGEAVARLQQESPLAMVGIRAYGEGSSRSGPSFVLSREQDLELACIDLFDQAREVLSEGSSGSEAFER